MKVIVDGPNAGLEVVQVEGKAGVRVVAGSASNNAFEVVTPSGLVVGTADKSGIPLGGILLANKHTGWDLNNPGDTVEHLLTSVAIPANLVGLGTLEIIALWTFTNSVNSKTPGIRFGAANDLSGSLVLSSGMVSKSGWQTFTRIHNRATNSQIVFDRTAFAQFSTTASAPPMQTLAVDTTAPTFVVFSGTLALGTEDIKLESYSIRLLPGV